MICNRLMLLGCHPQGLIITSNLSLRKHRYIYTNTNWKCIDNFASNCVAKVEPQSISLVFDRKLDAAQIDIKGSFGSTFARKDRCVYANIERQRIHDVTDQCFAEVEPKAA